MGEVFTVGTALFIPFSPVLGGAYTVGFSALGGVFVTHLEPEL